MGANPVQVDVGEFDEAIEEDGDAVDESKATNIRLRAADGPDESHDKYQRSLFKSICINTIEIKCVKYHQAGERIPAFHQGEKADFLQNINKR